MSKVVKWVLATLVILAAAFLIWPFVQRRKAAATEAERARPVKVPARVTVQDGQTFIKLDVATQTRNRIEVDTLKSTSHRQELRANALVLSVQELTGLRNSYLSASVQVEKAKLALDVSRREYERLNKLYQDNQNASAKAVQAAEATWRSDEASLKAARDSLLLNESAVRQSWGDVISKWLVQGSPAFDLILAQEELLLQVSLPVGPETVAPETVSLQTPDGRMQPARRVSAFPRVDPRIQNPSFLYLTPSRGDLVPGMNLVVLLPSGPSMQGVAVPSRAVVWWQGRAWAYAQVALDRFVRRDVLTEMPMREGWFVTTGFAPGDKVVTKGAQRLLSEEFRSQVQVLGEGEEGGE